VGPPITPPRPVAGQLAKACPQRRVILSDTRLAALGRTVLCGDLACPPLREAQTVFEHEDRKALTPRARAAEHGARPTTARHVLMAARSTERSSAPGRRVPARKPPSLSSASRRRARCSRLFPAVRSARA
jgi:hypothetical protein